MRYNILFYNLDHHYHRDMVIMADDKREAINFARRELLRFPDSHNMWTIDSITTA